MEYRQLGGSGLRVPVLAFGTATFGGGNEFYRAWGSTQVNEASRFIDLCLDSGLNFFDTADSYSNGLAEEILGQALGKKRGQILLASKAGFRTGTGPNDTGSSRYHLIKSCEESLSRLQTDYFDLYQVHGFDALTPVEETLRALDDLVRDGKVRYIGCSNYSGWHLMKSLAFSTNLAYSRYISHQVHYSLLAREFEWELMPLAIDQQVGTLVWSPLSGGRLSGKYRRSAAVSKSGRLRPSDRGGPFVTDEFFYNLIDVLEEVAFETGKTVSQTALNWLLRRPTVASVILGARTEDQLKENLGAVDWSLSPEQVSRLETASNTPPIYPYWHQRATLTERNPPPIT